MTTIATAADVIFTPTASPFAVQVTGGGSVILRRRSTALAAWVDLTEIRGQGCMYIDNPVAGAQYVLAVTSGAPAVQVDQ